MDNLVKIENNFIDFDENGSVIIVPVTVPVTIPTIPIIQDINKKLEAPKTESTSQRIYRMNMGNYECNICHKRFMKKSYCTRHELSHETTNLFECKVCNKKFMHYIHLNQHMKLHQEKQHQCDICGIKMFYKFNLDKHRKNHIIYTNKMGEKKYL